MQLAKDRATAHDFHSVLCELCKTGNPNGADLPNWPKFNPARSESLSFTPDSGPVFGPDPWN